MTPSESWTALGGGLGSLLDTAVGALVLLEADGRIACWNSAARETFGWTRGEAVGADVADFLISERRRLEFRVRFAHIVARAGEGPRRQQIEIEAMHRDGAQLPVELLLSIVDAGDRWVFAALLRDLSESNATKVREGRLEAVVASSGEAIVSCSLDGTIESWNPAAEQLYAYSEEEAIGSPVSLLIPGGTFVGLGSSLKALANRESVWLESTVRRKDGELVDIAVTLSPLCVDGGPVTGVASIARDITERNRTAARLAQATSRFAGAFQAASTGIALVAADGSYLEVNPALCLFLARDAETLLATTFQELTHPDDLPASAQLMERIASGELETGQLSNRYLLPDGGIVWGLATVTVVRDEHGAAQHFVVQVQDITTRKTAEGEFQRYAAQLASLSEQDPLTGLSNEYAFTAALREELAMFATGAPTCSVLVTDVRGDDSATLAAAAALERASRGTDLVARLDSGELVVLLPGIDVAAVPAVLRRARDSIPAHVNVRFAQITALSGESVATVMARLHDALTGSLATSADLPLEDVPVGIGRLLEMARRQLGMPVSFMTRIRGDDLEFARFAGEYEQFGVPEGAMLPFAHSHCRRMLDGRIASTVPDLALNAETRDLDITQGLGLRAYAGVPIRLRSGEIFGTLCTVDTEPHPELGDRQAELLRFLSEMAAELIEGEAEQQAARRFDTSAIGVRTLLVALEARDVYTGEHSKQVVALATAVAHTLGLDDAVTRDVEQVALLHDIGKVGIPDAILQKQGPLDDQEWQLMRQHPVVGGRIVAGTSGLAHLSAAVRAEHERWDGGGYPDGLAAEAIPIASRITFACDALHAMTSDRPYRAAMSTARACEELRAGAGSQFDPAVVDALLAEIDIPLLLAR